MRGPAGNGRSSLCSTRSASLSDRRPIYRRIAADQNGLGRRPGALGQDVQERSPCRLRENRRNLTREPDVDAADVEPFEQLRPGGKLLPGHLDPRTEARFENFANADQIEQDARFLIADPQFGGGSRGRMRRAQFSRNRFSAPGQSQRAGSQQSSVNLRPRKGRRRTKETGLAWFPPGMSEASFLRLPSRLSRRSIRRPHKSRPA